MNIHLLSFSNANILFIIKWNYGSSCTIDLFALTLVDNKPWHRALLTECSNKQMLPISVQRNGGHILYLLWQISILLFCKWKVLHRQVVSSQYISLFRNANYMKIVQFTWIAREHHAAWMMTLMLKTDLHVTVFFLWWSKCITTILTELQFT
jgi:hypothetical protein